MRISTLIVTLSSLFTCMMPVLAQDVVNLLPGVTSLNEVGVYTVGYQSYNSTPVILGKSWIGHFEAVSGVSYIPGDQVQNRRSILLHSPWRAPVGAAFVEYPLQMPDTKPIHFTFGIAMRSDVLQPNRSDGATFSVAVISGTKTIELMREHYFSGVWKDFDFDLSEYAGQKITLRLQTEPGPNNDPGFDFSYFGSPLLTVGDATTSVSATINNITSTKAYQAALNVDLRNLSNRSGDGIFPSNLFTATNSLQETEADLLFTYMGEDCKIVYRLTSNTGTLDDVFVKIDDSTTIRPMAGGGVWAVVKQGEEDETQVRLTGGRLKDMNLDYNQNKAVILWEYMVENKPLDVTWEFSIINKALTVKASCAEPKLVRFSLGQVGDAPLRQTFNIPYLPDQYSGSGQVAYVKSDQFYVGRLLDWTQSNSSLCPNGESSYAKRTDGQYNPLLEVGYVAVSPNINEVLPNIPWQPSKYVSLLGSKMMLDIWGQYEGTFQGSAKHLRNLKDNGVDHVAIINHDWQRFGYDVKLPDHIPANPNYGGNAGMIEFGKAANECGYTWSLHENYIDLYPDAPSYDPTARVLWPDGNPSPAWFNAGTNVQSYGLKSNRALGFAKENAPFIHNEYGTNAAYLDVHTCVPPWHQLDHDATQPMASIARYKVTNDSELFDYMRETHKGPLFGEGANHAYWAGVVDGVEAQVYGGENHTPCPDFDLLKVHPQMVNHGMGYYERWFINGYQSSWGHDVGTMKDIDKYRTQEATYGHAGWASSGTANNLWWVVREHHLMHPMQRLYGTYKPVEILYEIDGKLVTSSVAMAVGMRDRIRIRYESGLTIWANWGEKPWLVEKHSLPQWGFLALGPDTEVSTSLTSDGLLKDYVQCPEYIFADARTYVDFPYISIPEKIEPKLHDLKYLGDGKISVTYEWHVNEDIDKNYSCFVHFLAENRPNNTSQIAFQNDHQLAKPSSQWKAGDVIIDGPYEVEIEKENWGSYDLVVGLLDQGSRVRLQGLSTPDARIIIARLTVGRDTDDNTTGVKVDDPAGSIFALADKPRDFTENINPEGTMIDFGTVITDGSVKIEPQTNGLLVYPYPRDKKFTIKLDVAKISGQTVEPDSVKIKALAALTKADMGPVAFHWEGDKLVFEAGLKGAGRYLINW